MSLPVAPTRAENERPAPVESRRSPKLLSQQGMR